MESHTAIRIVELTAIALEIVGVGVIAIAFLYAALRALHRYRQQPPQTYERLKIELGRGLQLGLEFLVAADIVSTVTVDPSRHQIISLGLLILLRTFLSWSITVEIEGCWPWQIAQKRKALIENIPSPAPAIKHGQ